MRRGQWLLLGVLGVCIGCAPVPARQDAVAPASEGPAVAVSCPVGFPSAEETAAWRARVNAARRVEDPAEKREAMAVLVRDALDGMENDVFVVRSTSPEQVDPVDYRPVPAINFDMLLNQKQSAQLSPNTRTRSLANNGGYYFSKDRVPHVVLGPKIIDSRGPLFIREYVEHELYHARNHVGDHRPIEHRELETWTQIFVDWFHKKYPYRMRWGPMIQYYERSSATERARALDRLVQYYNEPPTPPIAAGCVDEVRTEFAAWLGRRAEDERTGSMRLIDDLHQRLRLTPPALSTESPGSE